MEVNIYAMLWYLKNSPRDGKKSFENINLWTKQQLKVGRNKKRL